MKKTSLLLGSMALALSMSAQTVIDKSPVFGGNLQQLPARYHNIVDNGQMSPAKAAKLNHAKNKTTAGGERWYSFYDVVADYEAITLNDNSHSYVFPIWFDSTMVVNYTSGPSSINFAMLYQYIDPINSTGLINSPNLYLGEMKIGASDSYTIDSLYIRGSYIANVNRPGGIVDTMVISVAPSAYSAYRLYRGQANYHNELYLPTDKDTLFAFTHKNIDSVGRGLFADNTGGTRLYWKVPLTVADRDTESSTGFPTKYFIYALPNGGITIPAGSTFSYSFSFKSGDTWTPNVDSVETVHHFMPIGSRTGNNTAMPYYYYMNLPSTDPGERSSPGLIFTTLLSSPRPTVMIESRNSVNFAYEFFDMGAHVACATCGTIVINSVKNVAFDNVGNAYPNPATGEINLPFSLKEAANVNVSVSNVMGQVIKTQNLGKFNANQRGKATLSTTDLTNGIYFITLEANGQRETKRFVVAN